MDDLETLTGEESQAWRSLKEVSSRASSRDLTTEARSRCPPEAAARRARILIGSYRRAELDDPEVYFAAVVAVLSAFPEDVVVRATDPLTGLPSRCKWPPSIAEVRSECDRLDAPRLREIAMERQEDRDRADRDAWQANRGHIPKAKWDALRRKFAAAEQAMEPTDWQAHADDLRRRYAANPVKLSPEIVERMGYLTL